MIVELNLLQAIEQIGKQEAQLKRSGNNLVATIPFLESLADWLEKRGGPRTITAAWCFWQLVADLYDRCTAVNRQNATIAAWYGVDPSNMAETTKAGLLGNLPRIQAARIIFEGNYDSSNPKGVYQLFKLAYDDEEKAQKEATEAAKRLVERATKK